MIVPGSLRWPEDRVPREEEINYAEMDPGSVLIYAAWLLHGGGANLTNQARTGIVISYCLGWPRQCENQYLSYPPEIARTSLDDDTTEPEKQFVRETRCLGHPRSLICIDLRLESAEPGCIFLPFSAVARAVSRAVPSEADRSAFQRLVPSWLPAPAPG
jgi:hypothetical protein